MKDNEKEFRKIRDEVVACQKCKLYKTRNLPVIGQGSHLADIVFIGEAPGAKEDKTGYPFCGQAGNILDELLQSAGIKREDIYITNILKCRPPGNRNPLPDEIESCTPYLMRQLILIKPEVIACLGNFSLRFIFNHFGLASEIKGISQLHGQAFRVEDELLGKIKIIPLYHPAVAVYNANMKQTLLNDFKALLN